MSVLDKFLSIMRLDDEEDYEDDLFDEDDDFDDEPKKGIFKKNKKDYFYTRQSPLILVQTVKDLNVLHNLRKLKKPPKDWVAFHG